ncbi:hypothetical protein HD806DRAFT_523507 [Xylariaceae sp. AK1471]|nr:hypothetical protein HD806DRAFT_523507 [Xylariaceae sp. AK1471]
MGSLPAEDQHVYPSASDPSLVLTHPTAAEKQQTWRLNHGEWGGALDLSAYLKREPFLASTPLSTDGGMMHWILTETSSSSPTQAQGQDQDQKRRVLASCETIRKRVLYAPAAGNRCTEEEEIRVREGLGYGIGSVYTYPEFRGKKYAARMLKELGVALKTWPKEEEKLRKLKQEPKETICSALWSDIGKKFYASKGWPVFASEHVEFPVFPSPSSSPSPTSIPSIGIASVFEKSNPSSSLALTPVNSTNLAQLCIEDETQLRAQLIQHARETGRTAFAFAPEVDVFRWHWSREEFIVSHVWPGRQVSEVRGMVATQEKTRMWAVWARNYGADAATNPAKNTLYILRLVISSSSPSSIPDLQLAFNAILHSALDTARTWNCGAVHLWNPTPLTQDLISKADIAHSYVHRDVDSIPSMMWYGPKDEQKGAVDWIANEKYCWC